MRYHARALFPGPTLMLRALFVILCLAPAAALAADEREYQVEVLVFEQLAPARGEVTRLPDAVPVFSDRPDPGDEAAGAPEEPALLPSDVYRVAARGDLHLRDVWGSLRRSRDFRPLMMTGWIQPGYARDDAAARQLVFRTDDGAEINGHITLGISRFVHLDVDLSMDKGGKPAAHINESRRMKRDEFHYFDHPRFGVIAVVWRLDDPPEPL